MRWLIFFAPLPRARLAHASYQICESVTTMAFTCGGRRSSARLSDRPSARLLVALLAPHLLGIGVPTASTRRGHSPTGMSASRGAALVQHWPSFLTTTTPYPTRPAFRSADPSDASMNSGVSVSPLTATMSLTVMCSFPAPGPVSSYSAPCHGLSRMRGMWGITVAVARL